MHVADSANIFLPELSLAFEFQGETHYQSIGLFGSFQHKIANDKKKAELSKRIHHLNEALTKKDIGVTLLCIPYWWDRSITSLAGLIKYYRDDIPLSAVRFSKQKVQEMLCPPHSIQRTLMHSTLYKSNTAETLLNHEET